MFKYKKIYFNGREPVAEFEDEDGQIVRMDEPSLQERIANGEYLNQKVNVEKKALKFLRAHDKYVPPKS